MKFTLPYFIILFIFSPIASIAKDPNLILWYQSAAKQWEEHIPLGNGKIGMMPSSGVDLDEITLNDITLWSGSVQDANNYEANKYLGEIRKLILEGKNEIAQELINQHFICKGPGSGGPQWGCYQTMGNLLIKQFYGPNQKISEYRRELDLNNAISKVQFTKGNITYKREYFTSFHHDAGFIKLSASKKKSISLELTLTREEKAHISLENNVLIMEGQLENGIDGKGMKFISRLAVNTKDGKIEYTENSIKILNASEVNIYLTTGTNFKDADYLKTSKEELNNAIQSNWNKEIANHIKNYRSLFGRLDLQIGNQQNHKVPTDIRLEKFQQDPGLDPGMASLFFQFGRYLSISSTRIGLLPPNLQGLWANQIQTAWNGDYHLDVNVQMNHWHLGAANLSELELPLVELVEGLQIPGSKTAKAYYNAPGWVAHVITNIWGFTEPGEAASWGIANAGSGWLCNNLWSHFEYTQDIEYLKRIYPILKGAAQFYNSSLFMHPKKKWLLTSPSVSPENAFYLPNGTHANVSMGPTMDNQIIRELFVNVIFANKILDLEDSFADTLSNKIKNLPPIAQIGSDGRVLEWLEEYKEVDPQHRHISHLYGLYPANLISVMGTPEIAEASKKTLNVRGDDGPSWAIAYKMIFWAKLHDSERAYKLFKQLLTPRKDTHINYGAGGGTYPNMFTAGPPFQIDGNFGGAAAIAEMLVQNNPDNIELLPAIPQDWKIYGKVKGLKAKGNISIDMEWKNGKIISYKLYCPSKKYMKVMVNGSLEQVKIK
ncbi:glycoside hydrolase family 95 protein [Sphingobacterium endophyticum]|uniref:glycoside hydrolase family 95 protein n=1 Tax=Sphingobacterium endophyticum TaxID=2546448 RepID=UPI0018CEA615|nr:glycoside hydrolase family 95 protein [Sphingobacterium endophyticum]